MHQTTFHEAAFSSLITKIAARLFFFLKKWAWSGLALAAGFIAGAPQNAQAGELRFDVNDVSFLFPIEKAKDRASVESLISLADQAIDGDLMSDEVFNQLMVKAKGTKVEGTSITFPPGVAESKKVWKVVGIRVNPSALGSHPVILGKAGQAPGLRLIVQPVTVSSSGEVEIHDIAIHVAFTFVKDFVARPLEPDAPAFEALVKSLGQLKLKLKAAGVNTNGEKLRVHPAFGKQSIDLTQELRLLLKEHINSKYLGVFSFMGIENGFEPWIFFSVMVNRKEGKVTLDPRPVGGNFPQGPPTPTAQKMDFRKGGEVIPAPVLDPRKNEFTAFGISTAPLFAKKVNLEQPLVPDAQPLFSDASEPPMSTWKFKDIPDLIANPTRFFNTSSTDCASCHSETTRRLLVANLNVPSPLAYKLPANISGVDASVIQSNRWNVRDFGWGLNFGGPQQQQGFRETVTQRAANEAALSADMINTQFKSLLDGLDQ